MPPRKTSYCLKRRRSKSRKTQSSKSHIKKSTSKRVHFLGISHKKKIKSSVIRHYYGKNFDKLIPPGFRLVKILGEGASGKAYLVCHNGVKCRAYKVSKLRNYKDEELFFREAEMIKRFNKFKLAPHIYRVGTFKRGDANYGLIEMDLIDGTLDDLLSKHQSKEALDEILADIDKLISQMCKHGLIHGDFHTGNIGYKIRANGSIKLILIDFGYSCCLRKVKCQPRLEYIQLLRTLSMSELNPHNEKYLFNHIISLYRERFNSRLKSSKTSLEEELYLITDKYRKHYNITEY